MFLRVIATFHTMAGPLGPPVAQDEQNAEVVKNNHFFALMRFHKVPLQQRLALELSFLTEEQIDEHLNWYLTFLQLNQAKKEYVEEWKKKKASHRAGPPSQQMKLVVKEMSQSEIKKREQDKERIAQWKQQQLEKKREEQRAQEDREKEEKRRRRQAWVQSEKDAEEKRKDQEIKAKVIGRHTEFLESKLSQATASSGIGPAQLARLREKDMLFERNRKLLKERKEVEREDRKKRLDQLIEQSSPGEAERDPSRLLRPTVIQEMREHERLAELAPEPGPTTNAVGVVKSWGVPAGRLAMPQWRRPEL